LAQAIFGSSLFGFLDQVSHRESFYVAGLAQEQAIPQKTKIFGQP